MELESAFNGMSRAAAIAALCFSTLGYLRAADNTFLVSTSGLNFSYQVGAKPPAAQEFDILSSGDNGQFTITATTTSQIPWLNGAFVLNNTTPAKYRVVVFPGSLSAGTYTGQLAIRGTGFTQRDIPVTLRVTNTSELSFTPSTPLAFTATVGSGPQTKTLLVNSSGSPLTYGAVASTQSGGAWLSFAPTSGTTETPTGSITVTVNPGSLGVGKYSGFISAQAPGASNTQGPAAITSDVTLTIVAAPQLSATPSALTFNFQTTSGLPPSTQTVNLSSAGVPVAFTTSIDTGATPNWFAVKPSSGTTPSSLSVSVNTTGLPNNTYTGKITVNAAGAAAPLVINVTLVVSNLPLLNIQPSSLLFTSQVGQTVPNQTLNLATTGGTLPFKIEKSANTDWLYFDSSKDTASTTATQVITGVNTSVLSPGTYTGTFTVTSADAGNPSQVVNVTLVLSAAVTLNLSKNVLNFTTAANGPTSVQSFDVTSSDGGATSVPFAITAITSDGGNWLSTNIKTSQTPALGVGVSVDPAGLSPRKYSGTITVTGVNSATPQLLPVDLTVTQSAFSASPASLSFTQVAGSSVPTTQKVQITTPTAGATVAVTSTSSPQNLFTVELSSATTPTTLTVGIANNTLPAGTYNGTINISGTSGQTSIPVTLMVTTTPPLILAPTSLSFDFQTGGTVPVAKTIAVSTSGSALNFNAVAATSSGGTWLAVTPGSANTPSQLTVTVTPAGLTPGTYTGTITTTPTGSGAGPAAVVTVTLNVTTPAPASVAAFVNGATFAASPAVPGMIVTLFGTAMGPSTGVNANVVGGFFETKTSDTRVLFDGVAAPLIYTSAIQVSAIVPYTLFGRLSTSVQVEYLGVKSNSLVLRVDGSQPGLFSANQTGKGPGAILNQDNTLNTPNNPATKGQAIVLFGTGEGQTTPGGIDGKIIGADLRKPLLPWSVRVGGVDCPVEYAGSAPGLVSGVIQVNVRLTSAVPSGNVPVVLQIGSAFSQEGLTVSVR